MCVCEQLHARECMTINVFWNLKGAGIGDNEQDKFLPQDGKIFYQ